jgi:hypothetical protein
MREKSASVVTSNRKWTGIDVAIADMLKQTRHLAHENKSVLLTAVGVVGTVTTGILSFRAGYKASEIIDEEAQAFFAEHPDHDEVDFDFQTKMRLAWSYLIPPVGVGAFTIAAIIFANRVDAQKAAALAAAYGVSERTLQEYREKVVERLGEKKEQALRDEIAQDRLAKNPVEDRQVIIAGSGEVLCYDNISGRYFQSSMEELRQAENKVNYELVHHNQASLSFFYDQVGLPPTRHSDEVGWNSNNLLEINYSTQLSTDNRPCIVVDFVVGPITGYGNLY